MRSALIRGTNTLFYSPPAAGDEEKVCQPLANSVDVSLATSKQDDRETQFKTESRTKDAHPESRPQSQWKDLFAEQKSVSPENNSDHLFEERFAR